MMTVLFVLGGFALVVGIKAWRVNQEDNRERAVMEAIYDCTPAEAMTAARRESVVWGAFGPARVGAKR